MSVAAFSNAAGFVGTYYGDAFVTGLNVVSTTGVVNVEWQGYETPYQAKTAWRVVIWDPQVSARTPVVNEWFYNSPRPRYYSHNYQVPFGHTVRVELYAAGNQMPQSWPLSHSVITYFSAAALQPTVYYQAG